MLFIVDIILEENQSPVALFKTCAHPEPRKIKRHAVSHYVMQSRTSCQRQGKRKISGESQFRKTYFQQIHIRAMGKHEYRPSSEE
jgi:hypothetical protein